MKVGIVDRDSFVPKSWDPRLGERVFQYDAFISHNRGDKHSGSLEQYLANGGANVWYYSNADMRDRKVQEAVSEALRNARFVVVSVDEDFRNSPWCMSEYLPALETERESDTARVIVARMTADAPIPPALQAATCIECYEKDQVGRLLDEVTAGNRVSSLRALHRNQNQPTVAAADVDAQYRVCANENMASAENAEVLALLWKITLADPEERPIQALQAVRQMLTRVDSQALTETQRRFAMTAALFICAMPDASDRANGLMILLYLCEPDEARHMRLQALMMVANEADDSIISLCFGWLDRVWPRLTNDDRAYGDLLAVRDPVHLKLNFAHSSLVKNLSPAVRTKVFVRGLETESLPPQERMFILEQRIDYILENRVAVAGPSSSDALRGIMGISDVEIALRNLDAMFFDRYGKPRAGTEMLAGRYAKLLERIVLTSSLNKGFPLLLLTDWIFEYVLIPLLWCSTVDCVDVDTKAIYLSACDLMTWSEVKEEVPGYRLTQAAFKEFKSKWDFHIT